MNKLIDKLAEQCYVKTGSDYTDHFAYWKFAELIVKECLEQVRDEVQYEYDWKLADAVSKRVLEHFGVEESPGWVCPKCGTDRTKAACPQGYTAAIEGKCPMIGVAHGVEQ